MKQVYDQLIPCIIIVTYTQQPMRKVVLLIIAISCCQAIQYQKIFNTTAHGSLTLTAGFFNDKQRMISGGTDNTAKIWSLNNFSILHTITLPDIVNNIQLHPVDNRIFIAVGDGNIYVHQASAPYALITTVVYTATSGDYPNYLIFDVPGNRFFVGGYQYNVVPKVYIFDSTSYAALSSITTTFAADDAINTLSINADSTHLAVTCLFGVSGNWQIQFYNIVTTISLINSFSDFPQQIKWGIFDNVGNRLCATSLDNSIRCYRYDTSTGSVYVLDNQWSVTSLGIPFCMNFGVPNTLMVTIGNQIVFFNTTSTPSPTNYLSYTDIDDIFVLDSTVDMSYLVTGMNNGKVGIWRRVIQPGEDITQTSAPSANIPLIVGLTVGITGFFTIVVIFVYCCCWGALKNWRRGKSKTKPQLMNFDAAHNTFQSTGNHQQNVDDRFIIIKGDQSDKSSEPDYDQLMAHGTIIIIKDDEKKRKFMKKLRKKNKNKHKQNEKEKDHLSNQSLSQLNFEGNIIIIRDQKHSLHKKNKNTSQTSSDPDYEQLMAEGNVIIIKDQEIKKKLANKYKDANQKQNSRLVQQLMAEGNIIIIKGDEQQKKLLKQIKKDEEIKKIKHDQILANGDMIVIKDNQKKKAFVEDLKKQIKKSNGKDIDLQSLSIATQIIVIRGDEDDEELTYQQLMAQGTIIVIKDDDIKKQYARHKLKTNKQLKQKNKKNQGSQKSSQPDYQTLMAEQCVIVIKDQNDRRDYVNFIKKRKIATEKSSNIGYDQLMNAGVMAVEQQKKDKKIQKQKRHSSAEVFKKEAPLVDQDYKKLMAQKNVVVIDENGHNMKDELEDPMQVSHTQLNKK